MTRLNRSGAATWQRIFLVGETTACCWGIYPGDGSDTIMLTPPDSSEPVRVVAVENGRVLEEFPFPTVFETGEPGWWLGTLAIDPAMLS